MALSAVLDANVLYPIALADFVRHEADRWVATTAVVLGLELAAGDGAFEGVPGLDLHRWDELLSDAELSMAHLDA